MTADRLYFAGEGPVPDLPHLIIVPGSVLQQWLMEIKRFFKPEAVDVFQLPTAKDEAKKMWEGPWASSDQPMYRRIVVTAHSVSRPFFLVLQIDLTESL
jgi:SNF2 family DNA or RNA helicase